MNKKIIKVLAKVTNRGWDKPIKYLNNCVTNAPFFPNLNILLIRIGFKQKIKLLYTWLKRMSTLIPYFSFKSPSFCKL